MLQAPPPPRAAKARKKKEPSSKPAAKGKKPKQPAPNDTTETFAKFQPVPEEDVAVEPFEDWGGFTEEFEVVDDEDASSVVSYEDSISTEISVSDSVSLADGAFDQPESPRASIWSAAEKRMKPARRASWRSYGSRVVPDDDDDIF
jgi:hypothetical protein